MHITKRDIFRMAGVACAAGALPGALKAEGMKDATATSEGLPFALTTPVHCREAALRVRDLKAMSAYYRDMLGLSELSRSRDGVLLGAGGTPLLHLIHRPDAQIEDQKDAGLYHIAYLMPSRQHLARWLVHIAMRRFPVTGFADHSVSEAVYLNDPEGNGIEVYSDRPREDWVWTDGAVTMGTAPLDVDGILALADTKRDSYTAAPDKLRIGHMHLRVGDLDKGSAFYISAAGLSPTRKGRKDAAFMSSGGYHHHVAMNIWQSEGAGPRDMQRTGLAWFSMTVSDKATLADQHNRFETAGFKPQQITDSAEKGFEVADPWGTRLRLVSA